MPFDDPGPKNTPYQKRISRATVRAQEQERNRIAAELHDNVNQLIVTAKLEIGMVRKDIGCRDETLKIAEEHLSQAIEAIRLLTGRLATSLVARDGLEKSITNLVVSMRILQVRVTVKVASVLIERFTGEQQLMVYRIVQEQTNNILKYAQAPHVSISLQQKGNMAELVICDTGQGFDKEKLKAGGIGFINIFNRATAFNGTVAIVSSLGNGCTLKVTFPLE